MPQLRKLDGLLLRRGPKTAGPAIAVTLDGSENSGSIRRARRLGARIFELRIDRFPRLEETELLPKIRFYRSLGLRLIATIRSRREGGRRTISDSKRLELFRKILPWVDAIDLELASEGLLKTLIPLAHRKGKQVVLSYHNFKSTPPDRVLTRLVRKAKRRGADFVKLAVTPQRKGDVGRLLLFTYRHRDQHLISIALGPRGRSSRILAPSFGSLLTYSFLGRSQAPGQIPLKELFRETHRKSAQSF